MLDQVCMVDRLQEIIWIVAGLYCEFPFDKLVDNFGILSEFFQMRVVAAS